MTSLAGNNNPNDQSVSGKGGEFNDTASFVRSLFIASADCLLLLKIYQNHNQKDQYEVCDSESSFQEKKILLRLENCLRHQRSEGAVQLQVIPMPQRKLPINAAVLSLAPLTKSIVIETQVHVCKQDSL